MTIDDIYVELIERLNYPNPTSPYLIRILEKMMTPEEGKLLLQFPATVDELAQKSGWDQDAIDRKIKSFLERGLLIATRRGPQLVRDVPQLHGLTLWNAEKFVDSEFLGLWKQFWEGEWTPVIAESWEALERPIGRIIPALKAFEVTSEILPEDNVREILSRAELVALVPCGCRRPLRYCDTPLDNCLHLDFLAESSIDRGAARRISVDEAIDIMVSKGEELGMVHVFAPMYGGFALCNCCSCCCALLNVGLSYGVVSKAVTKSHYRASVDQDLCNGCQDCVERCYFGAVEMKKFPAAKRLKAAVDAEKCFGCGLCAAGCESGAVAMRPAT